MVKRMAKLLASTTVVAAVATVGVFAVSAPASAQTETVCAVDLYVRQTAAGVVIGTLYKGDHFDVERYSPSREWVHGHAYGNVHKDGWVQNGWFC
ncbi:MAG: hypothetical protein WCA46_13890 [Actinocatenispora sp.]